MDGWDYSLAKHGSNTVNSVCKQFNAIIPGIITPVLLTLAEAVAAF